MVLALLRCRIMSMLYIFMIHDEFANIFSKKCWQIFRYSEIWQHQLILIADSTSFDVPKSKKMLSEISQNEKLYNIFHNITNDLQTTSQNATSFAVYYMTFKGRAIESQLGLTGGR